MLCPVCPRVYQNKTKSMHTRTHIKSTVDAKGGQARPGGDDSLETPGRPRRQHILHQFRVEEPPGDHRGRRSDFRPKNRQNGAQRGLRRSGARNTRSARITSPERLTIKLQPGPRQLFNSATSAIGPATKMNPSPWIWRAMMGLTGRAEAAEANDESNGKNSKTDKCEIDHYELHQSKEEYDEDEHELHQS